MFDIENKSMFNPNIHPKCGSTAKLCEDCIGVNCTFLIANTDFLWPSILSNVTRQTSMKALVHLFIYCSIATPMIVLSDFLFSFYLFNARAKIRDKPYD
jgi:hypothetical protein